jgi:hypothetical protein
LPTKYFFKVIVGVLADFAIKLPDSSASCSINKSPLFVKDPETVNFPSFEKW